MRIAIVSDIHGNRTAFEAVLADLRLTSPDLIYHGGDLADGGAAPAAIVDQIREFGWPGVLGNTDEMLVRPESLTEFAEQSPRFQPLLPVVQEMAAATRAALGPERVAWLRGLPAMLTHGEFALVHASPESPWRAPAPQAADAELESVYAPLCRPLAIYGHSHYPFVRRLADMTVVNTGSVSLSYDGDRRAAYLLLDDSTPVIRRVEYDVEREVKALADSNFPHAAWIAKILESGRPQMP